MGCFSIINELTDKTPVLRNAVSFDDEMYPMQEPIMDRKINVEVIYNKSAEQVLEFDKSLKFDFMNSPLIRFYYVKEESNASHLIISYHHILLDGWSITYIIEQIFGNYQNVAQGKPILISYNNYFQQIVDREETNVVDAKIEKYWEEEIEKIVPVEIEQKSGGSNLKSIFIEEDIVASIIEYAKNNKVTVNSIFLAAYIKALIGEAGKKTLGITLSGREDVSEEEMAAVGCLIKTLPINIDLHKETEFKKLVQKCHEKIAELYLYGKCKLSEIKKKKMKYAKEHIELFDDVYAFQNYTNIADLYKKYNIVSVDSAAEINYGRTLVVTLGKEVEIGMMYGQQYNAEDIDLFLKNIRKILIEEIQPLLGDQAMNVLAIVRSVWKEVLNNEQILDTDNFFELGGDSISSLRASLKLRDYGIFVPADSLFHYQSITELVNYIKSIGINQGKIREE